MKFIDNGRVCLIPLLKHAGRIQSAARQLEKLPDSLPVLTIDDEADQASLNTSSTAESKTYAAIGLFERRPQPSLRSVHSDPLRAFAFGLG